MKYAIPTLLIAIAVVILGTGCQDRGCTDPLASNYDPFAQRNDGNCIYRGCTDPNSTNFNPLATIDDGSCTYPTITGQVAFWSSVPCCDIEVSLNGSKVDTIEFFHTASPGCVSGDGIVRLERPVGNYTVYARTITGDSSQLYVWQDTIEILQNDCLTYQFSL